MKLGSCRRNLEAKTEKWWWGHCLGKAKDDPGKSQHGNTEYNEDGLSLWGCRVKRDSWRSSHVCCQSTHRSGQFRRSSQRKDFQLLLGKRECNEWMGGWEHAGLRAWCKGKIPALDSGGLGSDPHSAFMGCVLLDTLLNLSELRCLVCKMEI